MYTLVCVWPVSSGPPERPHLWFPVQYPRWYAYHALRYEQIGGPFYVGTHAQGTKKLTFCSRLPSVSSLITMSSTAAAHELATTLPDRILSPQAEEVDATLNFPGVTPISPATFPPSLQPPPPEEPESRPTTPQGRKKRGSRLSNIAKANIRVAVRNILDKDHGDDEEYFCLITGLSNYDCPLNYAYIVPGATPPEVVSLLVNT